MSTMSLEGANREAIRRIHEAKETGRRWLDLGDLPITRVPDEITELADQLTILALGQNGLKGKPNDVVKYWDAGRSNSITNIEPLQRLINVQILDLSGCRQLTTAESLRGLTALKTLYLSSCSQLRNLDPLRGLTALQILNLSSCDQLHDLDPLRGLTTLQTLELSYCSQLRDLNPLRGLAALRSLTLSSCPELRDLDPLRGLTALRSLNLSYCRAETFAPIRDRLPTLNELKVFGSRFPDLHPSACGSSAYDNAIRSIRTYIAAIGPDPKPDAEIKVFVLGNGRCGKTKLVGRLMGKRFEDILEGSTHGVKVESWPAPSDWNLPHPVRLNIWDFGGQDIYHGTHALFVREPAIYLLLYADKTENEDEIPEGGFVHHNRRLPYWFDYLRQEAGGKGVVNSPVLFIQTQCDLSGEGDRSLSASEKQSFPRISPLIHVSATQEDGLDIFLPRLKKAIKELLKENPQPPLPTSWTKVREAIRAMQQPKAKPAKAKRTLSLADLAKLCKKHGCPGDEEVLRDVLHLMGVVFYRRGVFNDRLIIDQSWALDAIYTIFTRNEDFQDDIDSKHGRFTLKQLERYFWKEKGHSVADQRTFLSFMEECGICFKAGQSYHREYEGEYIIPDKLDPWGPEHEHQFRRQLKDESGAQVVAEYSLLHDGIARTFLSKIGSVAGDKATYWRFGCYFLDGKTGSEVLIRTEGNSIRMQAWEGRADEVLSTLVEVLQKIPSGQPPKVQRNQTIATEAIASSSFSATVVRHQPEKQLQPEYPSRSVFISYSHETISREFVEKLLVPRLKEAGWDVRWDQEHLPHGESISKFCNQVREIPYLVPVIAGDYLKKRWCLSELLGFFEARACDEQAFRTRAVTAADLNQIDEPLLRAGHGKEAARLFESMLEEGEGFLDPQSYGQCQGLVGWSRSLAKILNALADDLGERGLAERTANKVVELLDRRYEQRHGEKRVGRADSPSPPPPPRTNNSEPPIPLPRKETAVQGDAMQEVRDALVAAYDKPSLTQMLQFRFDKELLTEVADGAFEQIVFDLLKKAEKVGYYYELIEAAYQYRSGNPKLREVYQKYARPRP